MVNGKGMLLMPCNRVSQVRSQLVIGGFVFENGLALAWSGFGRYEWQGSASGKCQLFSGHIVSG